MSDPLENSPELQQGVKLYIALKRAPANDHLAWDNMKDHINKVAQQKNATFEDIKDIIWFYGRRELKKQDH